MGNCLVLQGDFARVMETDGEILQQKSRIKVDESNLHYLLPQCESPRPIKMVAAKKRQTERFSDKEAGVVRMKLVISKKELQEILSKGEVSVGDVILKVQNQDMANKAG